MTSRYLIDIENRKSKIIYVYRNGDKYSRASLVLLRPIEQQKLERIFKAIEEKITLPYNKPIKRIYTIKGREIEDPIYVKDQKYYVVGSSENFIFTKYGNIFKWAIIGPVRWNKFMNVFYEPPSTDESTNSHSWKNNNGSRIMSKMTKSMSNYPHDRKGAKNTKIMTLSMNQTKRPVSEPPNDRKPVKKDKNEENSYFHSPDNRNSSDNVSVSSPKLISSQSHRSMDDFLNDSFKMYQSSDPIPSTKEHTDNEFKTNIKDDNNYKYNYGKSEEYVNKYESENESLTNTNEIQYENKSESHESENIDKIDVKERDVNNSENINEVDNKDYDINYESHENDELNKKLVYKTQLSEENITENCPQQLDSLQNHHLIENEGKLNDKVNEENTTYISEYEAEEENVDNQIEREEKINSQISGTSDDNELENELSEKDIHESDTGNSEKECYKEKEDYDYLKNKDDTDSLSLKESKEVFEIQEKSSINSQSDEEEHGNIGSLVKIKDITDKSRENDEDVNIEKDIEHNIDNDSENDLNSSSEKEVIHDIGTDSNSFQINDFQYNTDKDELDDGTIKKLNIADQDINSDHEINESEKEENEDDNSNISNKNIHQSDSAEDSDNQQTSENLQNKEQSESELYDDNQAFSGINLETPEHLKKNESDIIKESENQENVEESKVIIESETNSEINVENSEEAHVNLSNSTFHFNKDDNSFENEMDSHTKNMKSDSIDGGRKESHELDDINIRPEQAGDKEMEDEEYHTDLKYHKDEDHSSKSVTDEDLNTQNRSEMENELETKDSDIELDSIIEVEKDRLKFKENDIYMKNRQNGYFNKTESDIEDAEDSKMTVDDSTRDDVTDLNCEIHDENLKDNHSEENDEVDHETGENYESHLKSNVETSETELKNESENENENENFQQKTENQFNEDKIESPEQYNRVEIKIEEPLNSVHDDNPSHSLEMEDHSNDSIHDDPDHLMEENAAKVIQKTFRGHLVRKELILHSKDIDNEDSEGEGNRSYDQHDSDEDENDADINFSMMKDATNDMVTNEILDEHSQYDNSYPDEILPMN